MQTKLTLRLDQHLIEQAKRYAEQHGYSLSQLVADYFALLTPDKGQVGEEYGDLPPITRSLVGILKGSDLDIEDYKRYLEQKYV
jgi:hypothetical protein